VRHEVSAAYRRRWPKPGQCGGTVLQYGAEAMLPRLTWVNFGIRPVRHRVRTGKGDGPMGFMQEKS
jgi:hypothetical protein